MGVLLFTSFCWEQAKSSHCQFFCPAHAFTSFCRAHNKLLQSNSKTEIIIIIIKTTKTPQTLLYCMIKLNKLTKTLKKKCCGWLNTKFEGFFQLERTFLIHNIEKIEDNYAKIFQAGVNGDCLKLASHQWLNGLRYLVSSSWGMIVQWKREERAGRQRNMKGGRRKWKVIYKHWKSIMGWDAESLVSVSLASRDVGDAYHVIPSSSCSISHEFSLPAAMSGLP